MSEHRTLEAAEALLLETVRLIPTTGWDYQTALAKKIAAYLALPAAPAAPATHEYELVWVELPNFMGETPPIRYQLQIREKSGSHAIPICFLGNEIAEDNLRAFVEQYNAIARPAAPAAPVRWEVSPFEDVAMIVEGIKMIAAGLPYAVAREIVRLHNDGLYGVTDPEEGGKLVREVWLKWAREQPDVDQHPNWLTPWDELSERDKDVDRRIASALRPAPAQTGLREAAIRAFDLFQRYSLQAVENNGAWEQELSEWLADYRRALAHEQDAAGEVWDMHCPYCGGGMDYSRIVEKRHCYVCAKPWPEALITEARAALADEQPLSAPPADEGREAGLRGTDPPPNHLHKPNCRWYPARKGTRVMGLEWIPAAWVCAPDCAALTPSTPDAQEGAL